LISPVALLRGIFLFPGVIKLKQVNQCPNNKEFEMKTEMTTPADVRKALKQAGVPYNVVKVEGSWYVDGPATYCWESTCLYTFTFAGLTPEEWVQRMKDMVEDNKQNMLKYWGGLGDEEQAALKEYGISPQQ
jgi:hypothetical protein